ncbi:hypothetical protein A2U01_0069506, partial [Trifolium medium]|nr:hypothetical protein [Trifolium medium]
MRQFGDSQRLQTDAICNTRFRKQGARWASKASKQPEASSLQPGTFRLQDLCARWASRSSLGEQGL